MRTLVTFILIFSNHLVAAQTFFAFEAPITGQPLELKKMNDGYNYILFIGKNDSIYSVDWDNQKHPYEYAYQPLEDDGAYRKSLKEEGQFASSTANDAIGRLARSKISRCIVDDAHHVL